MSLLHARCTCGVHAPEQHRPDGCEIVGCSCKWDGKRMLRRTLRALLAEATPAPWEWDDATRDAAPVIAEDGETLPYVPECSHLGPTSIVLDDTYQSSRVDCALVAMCRNEMPTVLDALDAAVRALHHIYTRAPLGEEWQQTAKQALGTIRELVGNDVWADPE